MYFSVNCNGRSLMNSFIIPSLQAMNKVTNVRDAYKKASALRKSCFLKEIDEEQELPPYLESYLVPGEMHHTYWNQFSEKIRELRKNYLQTSLGFGSAGGGQLALNLLSAIHCSLKLADLIIEAR